LVCLFPSRLVGGSDELTTNSTGWNGVSCFPVPCPDEFVERLLTPFNSVEGFSRLVPQVEHWLRIVVASVSVLLKGWGYREWVPDLL
jgi:hypothetical protein